MFMLDSKSILNWVVNSSLPRVTIGLKDKNECAVAICKKGGALSDFWEELEYSILPSWIYQLPKNLKTQSIGI